MEVYREEKRVEVVAILTKEMFSLNETNMKKNGEVSWCGGCSGDGKG